MMVISKSMIAWKIFITKIEDSHHKTKGRYRQKGKAQKWGVITTKIENGQQSHKTCKVSVLWILKYTKQYYSMWHWSNHTELSHSTPCFNLIITCQQSTLALSVITQYFSKYIQGAFLKLHWKDWILSYLLYMYFVLPSLA